MGDEEYISDDQALGDYATNPDAADIGDDMQTWDRAKMMLAEDEAMEANQQASQMRTEDIVKEAGNLEGGHAEPPPFDPGDWTVNESE